MFLENPLSQKEIQEYFKRRPEEATDASKDEASKEGWGINREMTDKNRWSVGEGKLAEKDLDRSTVADTGERPEETSADTLEQERIATGEEVLNKLEKEEGAREEGEKSREEQLRESATDERSITEYMTDIRIKLVEALTGFEEVRDLGKAIKKLAFDLEYRGEEDLPEVKAKRSEKIYEILNVIEKTTDAYGAITKLAVRVAEFVPEAGLVIERTRNILRLGTDSLKKLDREIVQAGIKRSESIGRAPSESTETVGVAPEEK